MPLSQVDLINTGIVLFLCLPALAVATGRVSYRATGLVLMLWFLTIAGTVVTKTLVFAPRMFTSGFLSVFVNLLAAAAIIFVLIVAGSLVAFGIKAARAYTRRGKERNESNGQLAKGIGCLAVLTTVIGIVLHLTLTSSVVQKQIAHAMQESRISDQASGY